MKGEVGKETPQKEMDFYDVTHDTLGFLPLLLSSPSFLWRHAWLIIETLCQVTDILTAPKIYREDQIDFFTTFLHFLGMPVRCWIICTRTKIILVSGVPLAMLFFTRVCLFVCLSVRPRDQPSFTKKSYRHAGKKIFRA